jgi:GxxExxY protein
MGELWERMNLAHQDRPQKTPDPPGTGLGDKSRREYVFDMAKETIRKLQDLAELAYCSLPNVRLKQPPLLDNIEVLITFVDAILSLGKLGVSLYSQPFEPDRFIPLPGIAESELESLKGLAELYVPIALMDLKALDTKQGVLDQFLGHVRLGTDELATFNYDLVLERALWRADRVWTPLDGYVGISCFEESLSAEETDSLIRRTLGRSKCKVIKLHGSVNWQRPITGFDHRPNILLRSKEEGEPWLFEDLEQVAFPGPERVPPPSGVPRYGYPYHNLLMLPSLIKGLCDKPVLAANWRACQQAIESASQVVAIGYSFPAQDAASRLLLGLIRDRAELLVVGPAADEIADSVTPLVRNVVPVKQRFSEWVSQGCQGLRSAKTGKGDPRTYAIIGAGMEVHKEMGCGFKEPLYQEAFAVELAKRGIPFEREKSLRVRYKDVLLEKEYSPDFVCFGEIVVEAKALDKLTSKEESQLLNYLKASDLHVGLLLNFGAESFEWRRMVL